MVPSPFHEALTCGNPSRAWMTALETKGIQVREKASRCLNEGPASSRRRPTRPRSTSTDVHARADSRLDRTMWSAISRRMWPIWMVSSPPPDAATAGWGAGADGGGETYGAAAGPAASGALGPGGYARAVGPGGNAEAAGRGAPPDSANASTSC